MTAYPRDDSGEIQVDFVWGNFPLQPDEDRGMATLDYNLDNHSIAGDGYSNYPSFIPNYDGTVQYSGNIDSALLNDDSQGDMVVDPDLEFVVPDVLRKSLDEADALMTAAGGVVLTFPHFLTISGVTSTGKTVRVAAYDTDYATWANASDAALIGLRVGDEVYADIIIDAAPWNQAVVKVTAVNNDGVDSWFEYKVATAFDPALDTAAEGFVYAGPNLVNIVTVVRPNTGPGTIQNEGRNINTRYFDTV